MVSLELSTSCTVSEMFIAKKLKPDTNGKHKNPIALFVQNENTNAMNYTLTYLRNP